MLKDAVATALREESEARDDPERVRGEPGGLGLDEGRLGDDAGPEAGAVLAGEGVAGGDAEGGVVADDFGEIEAGIGGTGSDGYVEEGREGLFDAEAANREGGFAGSEGKAEVGHWEPKSPLTQSTLDSNDTRDTPGEHDIPQTSSGELRSRPGWG